MTKLEVEVVMKYFFNTIGGECADYISSARKTTKKEIYVFSNVLLWCR